MDDQWKKQNEMSYFDKVCTCVKIPKLLFVLTYAAIILSILRQKRNHGSFV